MIFSDHFSLKVEFTAIPRKQENNRPESVWNLGKPNGWETYKNETDIIADNIKNIVEDEKDIDTVMKKIESIETKVKFKAFGKTKPVKVKRCGPNCGTFPCDDCMTQN